MVRWPVRAIREDSSPLRSRAPRPRDDRDLFRRGKSRGRKVEVGSLAALAVVLTWNLLRDGLPLSLDSSSQYWPWYAYLGQSLRSGRIPAWNPSTFGGTPFAADPLSGWTYWPAMSIFAVLPPGAAIATFVFAHFVLAGLATCGLARALGLPRSAAVFAAAVYIGSGFFQVDSVAAPPYVAVAAWLPVCLLGTERALQASRGETRWAWWCTAGFGLAQIIAAWPGQGAYYALLLFAVWTGVRPLHRPATPPRRLVRAAAHLAAPVIIGFALAAAGILPRLELQSLSNLANGYASQDRVGGWQLADFARLATPGPWYVGIVTLGLALAGLVALARRPRFLAACSCAPPRPPAKPMTAAAFAAASASGQPQCHRAAPANRDAGQLPAVTAVPASGLPQCNRATADSRDAGRLSAVTAAPSGQPQSQHPAADCRDAGQLSAVIAARRGQPQCQRAAGGCGDGGRLAAVPGARRGPFLMLAALWLAVLLLAASVRTPLHAALVAFVPGFAGLHAHIPERVLVVGYLAPALLAGLGFAVLRNRLARNWLAGLVAAAACLDLLFAGRFAVDRQVGAAWDPLTRVADFDARLAPSTAATFLLSQPGPFRYLGYDGASLPFTQRFTDPRTIALLVNNRAVSLGLQDIQGYDAVHLARFDAYLRAVNDGRTQNYHDGQVFEPGLRSPLLDLLSVRFIVLPRDSPPSDYPVVFQDDQTRVVERPSALPRGWLVHDVRLASRDEALQLVATAAVDPRHTAVVEEHLADPLSAASSFADEVSLVPAATGSTHQVSVVQAATRYADEVGSRATGAVDEVGRGVAASGAAHQYRLSAASRPVDQGRLSAASRAVDQDRLSAAHGSADQVLLVSERREAQRWQVASDGAGVLVMSEVFYPAWVAYVDGQRVPLLTADGLLRAVAVPAGQHVVDVRYESATLDAGIAISLVSLLGVGAVLARLVITRR